MTTDYSGAVSNGTTVLCYGDFGIITYSYDKGRTWGQYSIGDDNDIKKIIADGNSYYGITKTKVFKSEGEPYEWEIVPYNSLTMSDIVIQDGYLCILDANGIRFYTKEFQPVPNLEIKLPFSDEYRYLRSDGKNFFILKGDSIIIKYDPLERSAKEIQLKLKPKHDKIHQIEAFDGEVFALALGNNLFPQHPEFNFNTLYKLEDDSFMKLKDSVQGVEVFNKINGGIKTIASFLGRNGRFVVTHGEFKEDWKFGWVNFYGFDSVAAYIPFKGRIQFTSLIELSPDILLAVGNNKMIWMSTNGGKHWEPRCYFRMPKEENIINQHNLIAINDTIAFWPNMTEGEMATYDGGITWMPSGHSLDKKAYGYNMQRNFFPDGKAITVYYLSAEDFNPENPYNISISHDFGKTYKHIFRQEFLEFDSYDDEAMMYKGMFLVDLYIYNFTKDVYEGHVFFLNDSCDIIKRAAADIVFKDVMEDPVTGDLISYAFTYSQMDGYQYGLYRSKDSATTWKKEIDLNLVNGTSPLWNLKRLYLFGNKIIIPYSFSNETAISMYDLVTKKLESIPMPSNKDKKYDKLFLDFDNRIFSYTNGAFYYLDKNDLNKEIQSFDIKELFSSWSNNNDIEGVGKDNIFNAASAGSTVYMAMGRSYDFNDDEALMYKGGVSIMRIIPETAIEEIAPDKDEIIAFPNPCRDYVNLYLGENEVESDYYIYNSMGAKVQSGKIKDMKGVVNIKTDKLPQGIYYIKISGRHKDKSASIRVLR